MSSDQKIQRIHKDLLTSNLWPKPSYWYWPPAGCDHYCHQLCQVSGVLRHVSHVTRSDANTFPEFILPVLSPLSSHPSVSVRCAVAKHLVTIAELSTWLDMIISTCKMCHATTDYHSSQVRGRDLAGRLHQLGEAGPEFCQAGCLVWKTEGYRCSVVTHDHFCQW